LLQERALDNAAATNRAGRDRRARNV